MQFWMKLTQVNLATQKRKIYNCAFTLKGTFHWQIFIFFGCCLIIEFTDPYIAEFAFLMLIAGKLILQPPSEASYRKLDTEIYKDCLRVP